MSGGGLAITKKRWRLDQIRGVSHASVPADRAREHIGTLRAAGLSPHAIANVAGLSRPQIRNIENGQELIRPRTERAVLSVQIPSVYALDSALVPSIGAQRRVRALLALGWPHAIMQERSGVPTSHLTYEGAPDLISARKHRAVVGLYEALSGRPGPSPHTRARAARLGYVPPLAWDDDTIDDPDAQPDTGSDDDPCVDWVVVDAVLSGHAMDTTAAERDEIVPRLAERRLTDAQIADLCRVSGRTIARDRQRLNVESRWSA